MSQVLQMWQVLPNATEKLLQIVAGITKSDNKLLEAVTVITKCNNYYKVKRNISSLLVCKCIS